MILPIYGYGHPVLRKVGKDLDSDFDGLHELIANMWETMYNAKGVGLAAPQIGLAIRLFLVDSEQLTDPERSKDGIRKVFINAQIISKGKDLVEHEEGCLSIPEIYGDVSREDSIQIVYLNEKFEPVSESYSGYTARIILHEYDHIEGKLFIDHLKPLKKKRIQRKLEDLKKGITEVKYKMKFA